MGAASGIRCMDYCLTYVADRVQQQSGGKNALRHPPTNLPQRLLGKRRAIRPSYRSWSRKHVGSATQRDADHISSLLPRSKSNCLSQRRVEYSHLSKSLGLRNDATDIRIRGFNRVIAMRDGWDKLGFHGLYCWCSPGVKSEFDTTAQA